ncbi:Predicted methyltransferase [Phaffia rhodozyma]|uniref:Predicted methyltransferase n=1 Tax=Phaffia rhodozyma TaxID=264483 RepID=A0A0F7STX1_PHARH|nr:Predicted methyltransferase [Phaffia rhodozyma]
MLRNRSLARSMGSPFSFRTYAALSPNSPVSPYQVFDRRAKALQKDRAVSREDGARSKLVDYLRREISERVLERFEDVKNSPKRVLELSSGSGIFSQLLDPDKVDSIELIDMSKASLHRDPDSEFDVESITRTQLDEEDLLTHIPENSQDAIVTCMGLHWVNDLPGVLTQIQKALKPDGFFLGAMIGGESLFELRTSLQLADQEREGGISPHISPMADPKDASNLLQRAGFTLLTVDVEDIGFGYPSMYELVEDLRDMGEGNAILGRRTFLKRDTLISASAIYEALHGVPSENGQTTNIPATFEVIFLMGWKPADSQPKPLERGSGKTNLKDVL